MFAEREPSKELAGLTEVAVDGLADWDARACPRPRSRGHWTRGCATGSSPRLANNRGCSSSCRMAARMAEPPAIRGPEAAALVRSESFRRRLTSAPPRSCSSPAAEPVGIDGRPARARWRRGPNWRGRRIRGGLIEFSARFVTRSCAWAVYWLAFLGGPPAGPSCSRRGHRSRDRPRPPGMASGKRDFGAGRNGCCRAGAVRRPAQARGGPWRGRWRPVPPT